MTDRGGGVEGCAVCEVHRLAFRNGGPGVVKQEFVRQAGVQRRNGDARSDPACSDDPDACHVGLDAVYAARWRLLAPDRVVSHRDPGPYHAWLTTGKSRYSVAGTLNNLRR